MWASNANGLFPTGEALENALKKACGVKEKDDQKGGFLSFLGGNKDKDDKDDKEDKDKGGLFSFGDDKKDDDKSSSFFKFFNKDDDGGSEKKSGFQGLFSEQQGASGGGEDEEMPTFDEGANPGPGLNDGGT